MTMQVAFVNTDDMPIEVKHVCFFSKRDKTSHDSISLFEIVDEKYPHPEAPDDAFIWLTTTRCLGSYKINGERAAPLLLLEHAQQNAKIAQKLLRAK